MKELKGYFKGENDYFIGGYKVSNEISESKLYVYDKDGNYFTWLDMPDFWEKYLLEAWRTDKEIELKFEEYVIQELSL